MLKTGGPHATRLLPANQRPRCRALIGGETVASSHSHAYFLWTLAWAVDDFSCLFPFSVMLKARKRTPLLSSECVASLGPHRPSVALRPTMSSARAVVARAPPEILDPSDFGANAKAMVKWCIFISFSCHTLTRNIFSKILPDSCVELIGL